MSADKRDVLYGTLGLLVLKTLEAIAAGIVARLLKIREDEA